MLHVTAGTKRNNLFHPHMTYFYHVAKISKDSVMIIDWCKVQSRYHAINHGVYSKHDMLLVDSLLQYAEALNDAGTVISSLPDFWSEVHFSRFSYPLFFPSVQHMIWCIAIDSFLINTSLYDNDTSHMTYRSPWCQRGCCRHPLTVENEWLKWWLVRIFERSHWHAIRSFFTMNVE